MNSIKKIIKIKSGYERKQERLKIIGDYINEIKLNDTGIDIDKMVKELINDGVHISFQTINMQNSDENKSNYLIKKM